MGAQHYGSSATMEIRITPYHAMMQVSIRDLLPLNFVEKREKILLIDVVRTGVRVFAENKL